MKIEAQVNQNVEKKELSNAAVTNEEAEILMPANASFSQILNQEINQTEMINSDDELEFNLDAIMMSIEDAMFFVDMAQDGKFSVETTPTGEFKGIMQLETMQTTASQKAVEVTNQITELIQKAQNTQKPVRITFDNDVSVILKIDKHGKITAEFIPGSVEVENYLRANIPALRQRFDEQNLPYNDLLYRQNSRQNRNKNNKGEK